MRFFQTLVCTLFATQTLAAAIIRNRAVSVEEPKAVTIPTAEVLPPTESPDQLSKRAAGYNLYIAIYGNGAGADDVHWALVVGPKNEGPGSRGMRYHIVFSDWRAVFFKYEAVEISMGQSHSLLARIRIGEVVDPSKLPPILESVPVVKNMQTLQEMAKDFPEGYNCITWVQLALQYLDHYRVLVNANTNWRDIGKVMNTWFKQKADSGYFRNYQTWDRNGLPLTYDLPRRGEISGHQAAQPPRQQRPSGHRQPQQGYYRGGRV